MNKELKAYLKIGTVLSDAFFLLTACQPHSYAFLGGGATLIELYIGMCVNE